MKRHDLPDAGWVDLRDQDELSVRGRRGIRVLSSAIGQKTLRLLGTVKNESEYDNLGLSEETLDLLMRMQEATVVAFLAGWSYPDPLPTMASVGDMPAARYDYLSQALAGQGAQIALDLDMSPSLEPDPKDRTGA
jgi:hypothetical protein